MLSYRQAFSHCPHFFSNRLSLPLYHLSIYLSMLCYRQGFSHSAHLFSNRLSLPFSSRPVCCLSEIIFSGQMALGRMSAPSWREMKEAARGPTQGSCVMCLLRGEGGATADDLRPPPGPTAGAHRGPRGEPERCMLGHGHQDVRQTLLESCRSGGAGFTDPSYVLE